MTYEPLYDPTGGHDARIYAHQCAHEKQAHHIEEERICAGGGVKTRTDENARTGTSASMAGDRIGSGAAPRRQDAAVESPRPARALTNNEGDK